MRKIALALCLASFFAPAHAAWWATVSDPEIEFLSHCLRSFPEEIDPPKRTVTKEDSRKAAERSQCSLLFSAAAWKVYTDENQTRESAKNVVLTPARVFSLGHRSIPSFYNMTREQQLTSSPA
jgi:hypothetical protein